MGGVETYPHTLKSRANERIGTKFLAMEHSLLPHRVQSRRRTRRSTDPFAPVMPDVEFDGSTMLRFAREVLGRCLRHLHRVDQGEVVSIQF